MNKTPELQLDEPIVTGNIKAAIKAAGGKSGEVWLVPPDKIHFDPADNARPIDWDRVHHLRDLMIANNGFDRTKPLGGYVRRSNGHDVIHGDKGQHRYHAALLAIKAGTDIPLLPIVITPAKSLNRVDMIFSGLTDNDAKQMTPLELAENIVVLRNQHNVDNATICTRLNITDQTIRDVMLLADAPAELQQLVRSKTVAGTLAIGEIRKHGPEKALKRLSKGAAEAKAAGKTKVTKKHLDKRIVQKITDVQAKQLLQALQSVLHDPVFRKLSPATMAGVHAALTPLSDLLDAVPPKRRHPIHMANKHGVFTDCEVIRAQAPRNRSGSSLAEIHLAQPEDGTWIFSTSLSLGNVYTGGLPALHEFTATFPTRGQAIRAAVSEITRLMDNPKTRTAKDAKGVQAWLDKLYAMPDPDWTEQMANAARGVS